MAEYDKPHLTFDEQLARLVERGMQYRDHAAAIVSLKRIGYYRLSAYTYSFREVDQAGQRLDKFIEGATLEAVVELHDFDARLRSVLLAGLESFEVALRVQIAYTLGRRDKYGHLNPQQALDRSECDRAVGSGGSLYETWAEKYEKRCGDAKNEDFVRHFREKYDGRLPIWTATEVMDLGLTVRLYSFLLSEDRVKISRYFGAKREPDFRTWTKSLNLLRNHCAHGSRIWNRSLTYTLPAVQPKNVDSTLTHLSGLRDVSRRKLYPVAALLASMIVAADPYSNWPNTFATQAKKLPAVPGIATMQMMGFPKEWHELDLWRHNAQKATSHNAAQR